MGNGVGTFGENEVKHLSPSDRKKLRQHTVQHLQNSKEIRALMQKNPKQLLQLESSWFSDDIYFGRQHIC